MSIHAQAKQADCVPHVPLGSPCPLQAKMCVWGASFLLALPLEATSPEAQGQITPFLGYNSKFVEMLEILVLI